MAGTTYNLKSEYICPHCGKRIKITDLKPAFVPTAVGTGKPASVPAAVGTAKPAPTAPASQPKPAVPAANVAAPVTVPPDIEASAMELPPINGSAGYEDDGDAVELPPVEDNGEVVELPPVEEVAEVVEMQPVDDGTGGDIQPIDILESKQPKTSEPEASPAPADSGTVDIEEPVKTCECGVFLSAMPQAKKEDAAKLIAEIKKISIEQARQLTNRTIVPVLKDVAEADARACVEKFKKIGVSGQVTKKKS
ncbi:MAG: hypothetical protein HY762_02740 [Planctomycetes bacterium]|nr:hypothetical protein [Planctomycetota bacterium]